MFSTKPAAPVLSHPNTMGNQARPGFAEVRVMSLRSPSFRTCPIGLSLLDSPFHKGSPCSWGSAEDLILGLQEVATPRPPDPEGRSALAVRAIIPGLSNPDTCRARGGGVRAHGSADLLSWALALNLPWGGSCVVRPAEAPHSPLNCSSLRHSSCPRAPLRLVHGPRANPASHARALRQKEDNHQHFRARLKP